MEKNKELDDYLFKLKEIEENIEDLETNKLFYNDFISKKVKESLLIEIKVKIKILKGLTERKTDKELYYSKLYLE